MNDPHMTDREIQDELNGVKEPIRVYRFYDAPKKWREILDQNGGDEDWLAIIPKHLREEWIGWLDHGSFGCCCINKYDVSENGDVTDMKERTDYDFVLDRYVQFGPCVVGNIPELAGCKLFIGCHA